MARTLFNAGHSQIEWRRPGGARATASRRWFGEEERASFLQLMVPLVGLAIGSILVAVGILMILVLLLTALF